MKKLDITYLNKFTATFLRMKRDSHFWVLRTSSTKHVVFKWKDSNSNTNNFRFEFCEQNFKLLIFLYEIKEKYVNTVQKKER